RWVPEAPGRSALSLALARSRLAASRAALARGDRAGALDLAVSAYLDGFEPVEPALGAVEPALRTSVEEAFQRYRAALQAGRGVAEVEPLYAVLREDLSRVEERLAGGPVRPAPALVGPPPNLLAR